MLASEYGWTSEYIRRHVYPEEIPVYSSSIMRRRIQNYKMELAIIQNPYVKNPKDLWHELEAIESQFEEPEYINSTLDKDSFALIKMKLKRSKFVQVK